MLANPAFQDALQKIRVQFSIPYPATPEDYERWHTHFHGGHGERRKALLNALDDRGEEQQRFHLAIWEYLDALQAKYGVRPVLTWSMADPFDHAVKRAVEGLGLPERVRFFFVQALWSDTPQISLNPGLRFRASRIPGFSRNLVEIDGYTSQSDIISAVSEAIEWRERQNHLEKQPLRVLRGRPTQEKEPERLEAIILAEVRANDSLPKGKKMTREKLRETLWERTRDQGLHTLSRAGFKKRFYDVLKAHNIETRRWGAFR